MRPSGAQRYDPASPGERRPLRYDAVLVSRDDQSTGTGTPPASTRRWTTSGTLIAPPP